MLLLLLLTAQARVAAQPTSLLEVTATPETLYVAGVLGEGKAGLLENEPGRGAEPRPVPLSSLNGPCQFEVAVPRFLDGRDRIYSSFQLARTGADGASRPVGARRFAHVLRGISRNSDSFPVTRSKKGLQVQMLDDALELGVRHAALNLNFSQLVQRERQPASETWTLGNRSFAFDAGYVAAMDRQIKTLSEAGATVSLILLAYESGDPALNKLLLHPRYDRAGPNHLGAFNTVTHEGAERFIATIEFLAHRYCASNYPHGRVANFILGNEVNSHWFWSNRGRCSMEEFANDYLDALRLASTAVRKASSSARVYVSLEHHWNIRYPGGDAQQAFAGRPFLDYIHARSVEEGDFEWHIAFHPYPENLFECRAWNDRSATRSDDTPRITFKNIDLLTAQLARSEWRYDPPPNESYSRRARRVILSEQGFHCANDPEGELRQAAAYAYAYRRIARDPGIDAFILHRHVDHAHEGGLNLGLWTHKPGSVADPDRRRRMYEVFQKADHPDWEAAFSFALPVIGIQSWKEIETP
ncbi:MAG: hypothetical protein HYR88_05010 [Verrucomicrobia bacterium]|nr:hypothetical protein [Verrucomicrobiota bacterium]MBI3871178.1 hypothetical protein [Verrucomicrobiota bacterium]